MFTLPIGFVRSKVVTLVTVVGADSGYEAPSGTSLTIPMPATQSGDLILAAAAAATTDTPNAVSGYVTEINRSFTGIIQNSWRVYSKTAGDAESDMVVTFTGNGFGLFGVVIVLRNAELSGFVISEGQEPNTSSPHSLGSHTESDETSMSVLFGWANLSGTGSDADVSVEPSGYTLGGREEDEGGSNDDRILSLWYRSNDNLGAQSPQYQTSPASPYDLLFANFQVEAVSGGGGGGGGLSFVDSVAWNVSTSSTDITLTLPGGVVAGDTIIISAVQTDHGSIGSIGTPTGYTLLDSQLSGELNVHVFYKVAGGGEGNPTVPFTSGGANAASMLVFRGVTGNPTSEDSGSSGAGADPVEIPDYTEAASGYEMIFVGYRDADNSVDIVGITPGSFTNLTEDSVGGSMAFGAATVSYKENTSSGTISLDIDVDDGLIARHIRVRVV